MFKKLILKNYIPLKNSDIKEIEIDLSGEINIIIGPNGVGKSSILREINELPPDNADYDKEGSKYIEKMHNGKLYVLYSTTGKHNTHSFKVDGVEKNLSGTQSVQFDLVKKHFNITPQRLRIMNGLRQMDLFTNMPAGKRKEVLMDLYPNDTQYIQKVYNNLKSALRDTQGALKNQYEQLAQQENKLKELASLDINILNNKIKQLDLNIKEGLVLQGKLQQFDYSYNDEITSLKNKLSKLIKEVLLFDLTNDKTKEQLVEELQSNERILNFSYKEKDRLTELLSYVAESLSGLSLEEQNPKQFEENLAITESQLKLLNNELTTHNKLLIDHPTINQLDDKEKESLISLINSFINILTQVTTATDKTLTKQKYIDLSAKLKELENQQQSIEKQIEELNHYNQHYLNSEVIECEQCHHQFKLGLSKVTYLANIEKINAFSIKVETIKNKKEKLNAFLEDNESWFISMNAVIAFIKENSYCKTLILLIKEYNVGIVDCNTLINALKTLYKTFKLEKDINALLDNKKLLESRIEILKSNDIEKALTLYESTETQLGFYTKNIFKYKGIIDELNKQIELINIHEMKINLIDDLSHEIINKLDHNCYYTLKGEIEAFINKGSNEKEQLMKDLIKSGNIKTLVDNIKDNIKTLEIKHKRLKILVDGLCPNKGYIAKLMNDFIISLCGNINSIIRDIWVRPLFIKPCSKDNGDLTYIFPLVKSMDDIKEGKIVDISKASGGESEIINFAFREVYLRYQNKNNYCDTPLFLDEVGVMMESANNTNFFNYIKEKTIKSDLPQVYMVSHYFSQYGSLDNANVITLDNNRVSMNNCKIKTF